MKKLILTIIPALLLSTAAFAQMKVGYMNPQRALAAMPEYQQVQDQIGALLEQRDQELADEAAELQNQLTAFQQRAEVMPPEQLQQEQERLMKMNEDFEQKRVDFQAEIQQRRSQLLQPIITKVNTALETVAKEMQLDLVLNEQTSVGDSIIYFSANQNLNITDKVIAKALEL
jgi:Skp family chaperone for outer membrane proteins